MKPDKTPWIRIMSKRKEPLRRAQRPRRKKHKGRERENSWIKVKIPTVSAKKSLSLSMMMTRFDSTTGLHLSRDGMALTMNCKFINRNTKIWARCLKFIGRRNRKIWMLSFSSSLAKWNTSHSKMTLFFFTKFLKRSSRNSRPSSWLTSGVKKLS